MKIALHGATGRMGRSIARLCVEAPDISIVGAAAHADDPAQGQDIGTLAGVANQGVAVTGDTASALLGADAVIDFSIASAVPQFAAIAARQRVPIVMGTTNLSPEGQTALDKAAEVVPVVHARNMSLGVQVLAELVEQAVRRLGAGFDAEIVEVHHRHKVDAPSGTAHRLADAVRGARPEARTVYGREGNVGPRAPEELAVFGLRGGDVIGDHTVFLFGPGERIELTHRATNRDLFGQGAVRAARFVVGKAPGYYTIADVLGG